ncbi:MAG: hypothetical protein H6643_04815 [Caldilineaceae bacterium]|nr:hypothetical protein [Caldilineaceae bacterium]
MIRIARSLKMTNRSAELPISPQTRFAGGGIGGLPPSTAMSYHDPLGALAPKPADALSCLTVQAFQPLRAGMTKSRRYMVLNACRRVAAASNHRAHPLHFFPPRIRTGRRITDALHSPAAEI